MRMHKIKLKRSICGKNKLRLELNLVRVRVWISPINSPIKFTLAINL